MTPFIIAGHMKLEYEDHTSRKINVKKYVVGLYENSLYLYEEDDTRLGNSILSIDDSYDDVITLKFDKRFWVQIEALEKDDPDYGKFVFRAHKDDV